MKETIEVTVAPDGTIMAITRGMYGERCLDVFALLEHMTNGRIVDSHYTEDFTKSSAVATEAGEVNHGVE